MSNSNLMKEILGELAEYSIKIESFLKFEELGKLFYKFLIKEKRQNLWEFILDVNKFEKIKDSNYSKLTKKIFEKYFLEKSSSLNFDEFTKRNVKFLLGEQLEDPIWRKSFSPTSLFSEYYKMTLEELKISSLPRFSRSSEFLKIILKYKKNDEVLIYQKSIDYNYKYKDFNLDYALKKDIDFSNMLFKENFNWKLITFSKKYNAHIYLCDKNYLPKINHLKGKILRLIFILFIKF
jgi:hypothetical protein